MMEYVGLFESVNTVMRKHSGMEVRCLKWEYTDESQSAIRCLMLIGLRYGHPTWYEAKPQSLSPFQFNMLGPALPSVSLPDHTEHHAYQGVFTISVHIVDDPAVPAMLADQFEQWWKVEEEMELAEKAYKGLPKELQDAIGWFVDEPMKYLDFTQERDRFDWLLYQELRDLELVRTERWTPIKGRVYLLDKGMQITKYLDRQGKNADDES